MRIWYRSRVSLVGWRTGKRHDVGSIPVKWATYSAPKWATHSGGMWAGVRRAGRRGNNIITEVAHMGQEKSGCNRHLVSIVSSSSSRLVDYIPMNWAAIPVMWAPAMAASYHAPVELVRHPPRLSHSRSSVAALRRM